MNRFRMCTKFILVSLSVLLFMTACGGTAQTNTPVPTNTLKPTSAPPTKAPTSTPKPSATPNIAETQKADEFNSLLQTFNEKGYISTTAGKVTPLKDFSQEWAQIGWFQFWNEDVTTPDEFVFKAHFSWASASTTPEPSGCGFAFGIQENGDYYITFLDSKSILFALVRGDNLYTMGKTNGKGTTNFGNPAESDFAIAVNAQKAYVSVDGDVTTYTLSQDQTSAGGVAMSIMSGTNKDYGTKCKGTNMVIWTANK